MPPHAISFTAGLPFGGGAPLACGHPAAWVGMEPNQAHSSVSRLGGGHQSEATVLVSIFGLSFSITFLYESAGKTEVSHIRSLEPQYQEKGGTGGLPGKSGKESWPRDGDRRRGCGDQQSPRLTLPISPVHGGQLIANSMEAWVQRPALFEQII